MVKATNLGFPRIGAKRELKKATEAYWAGKISREELEETGKKIRLAHWKMQQKAGIDHIPSNDFAYYDHVLTMSTVLGAVPVRYKNSGRETDLDLYFAMARGTDKVPAMEMTKWFDTNYHYIVPEFEKDQSFRLAAETPVEMFKEAKEQGIHTRPVLIGPITYLLLGKGKEVDPLSLLEKLLPVYAELLQKLEAAGADWVQLDEPIMVLDQPAEVRAALKRAYEVLSGACHLRILVATYFEGLHENTETVLKLPVAGVHLDLVRAKEQLADVLELIDEKLILSLGVVDGRNIWRTDLRRAWQLVQAVAERLGKERVFVGPGCSLLHVPVTLAQEPDSELKNWLAFAEEKLSEIKLLADGVNHGQVAIAEALEESDKVVLARRTSPLIHNREVQARLAAITPLMLQRTPYQVRRKKQQAVLALPSFPTTTIGSFPQTAEIRKARADYKKGLLGQEGYEAFLRQEIAECIRFQEEIGLDVLVHGEAERNDMVEYFGELLEGYAFTKAGWVQSYGSRCVKPPVIFGDVSRKAPMTVAWSAYAQSLTAKPVKGMLTGPITMLRWAFVRDDQPASVTTEQIALALRDEVADLEKAGIQVIQIDEPAFREGLPLRRADQPDYLRRAADCFRLASVGVKDETQIHTHMCYSEFNDIIAAIARLDADVISIETSRSHTELLDAFVGFHYPNAIGPGVYDIHSPRVPSSEEMEALLKKALRVLRSEQIWVNPDCGLKTRKWEEVRPALQRMVEAAHKVRAVYKQRETAIA